MNPMMGGMNPMMGGMNPMMGGMKGGPMMGGPQMMGMMGKGGPMPMMGKGGAGPAPMMGGKPGFPPNMMGGKGGPMMGPMGMNPMMGMMGAGGLGTNAVASDAASGTVAPVEDPTPIDSRVKNLCRTFGIEHLAQKVHAALQSRDDFDNDVQALWHVMETTQAKNGKCSDVMLVKCREIDRGIFGGKDLLEPDIQKFFQKYDLDDRIAIRLIEMKRERKDTWRQDLRDIDARLSTAKKPAGLLVRLIEDLKERGALSPPPLSVGGPGVRHGSAHRGKADQADFERHRQDKARSRSRDRQR